MNLYCVVYAENFKYSTQKSNFYNSVTDEKVDNFVFSYYVLIDDKECFLIDLGFNDPKLAQDFEITLHYNRDYIDRIRNGRKITKILITHDHFDHTGNLQEFSDCSVYLQTLELQSLESNAEKAPLLRDKKIISFDTELEITENIKMRHVGGHTPGSSVVEIHNDAKTFIITGDECYRLENYTDERPIGNLVDVDKNRAFIHSLKESKNLVPLINHDCSNILDYPQLAPGLYKIF